MNWGMKMTDDHKQDGGLDALFDLARDTTPAPSDRLIAAVLADADDTLVVPELAPVQPRRPFFAQLLAAIGGWPSAAGLAAATLTGIWIGVSPPAAVDTLTAGLISSNLADADVLYGFDVLLAEG